MLTGSSLKSVGIKKYQILDDGLSMFLSWGGDWVGRFDHLAEYCEVVYLSRTEGVSSTMIKRKLGSNLSAERVL